MARGRMLNQKIAEDIEFNAMSMEAQFLFMRTIPFLDRDGLINGHPALLFGKTIPLMPEFVSKIAAIIEEWVNAGFVIRYMDDRTTVLFFTGFPNNQANLRYDRESKSEFAPPPGYRRTNTGLVEEGKEPNRPNVDDLPDDGGDDPDDDCATPANIRQVSGITPAKVRVEVEDQDQVEDQGEDHARATVETSAPNSPPFVPKANEYLPGIADPRKKQPAQRTVAERLLEAKALGLSAEQFRLVVDALLDGFGKRALVDAGDDVVLGFVQDIALTVVKMSDRFKDTEGVKAIFSSWREYDWRGKTSLPTSEQFKEHASLMVAGKVGKAAEQRSPPTYKEWKLRTYGSDSATVINIPESQLKQRYEQAIRVH